MRISHGRRVDVARFLLGQSGEASKMEIDMIRYVAGFLFDDEGSKVTLILKQKGPSYVVGKWNAVGGRIEESETSREAMSREFLEETGTPIKPHSWQMFLRLVGDTWKVDFYRAFSSLTQERVYQAEDEPIQNHVINDLPKDVIVPNLCWIIPMALDKDFSGYYEILQREVPL